MISDRFSLGGALACVLAMIVPGCILVGHTEHRVDIQPGGGALVTIRYTDLRSDGATDSAAARDLNILLESFASAAADERLGPGVSIQQRHLGLHGDTLVAEIRLEMPDLAAIDRFYTHRLVFEEGRPTVIVPEGQRITWTNGAVSRGSEGGLRIQWSDSATHLEFDIEPAHTMDARPLAPLYRDRVAPEG